MANLTDLTIKKADGVTDILWSGVTASAGDKNPARYTSKTVSAIPAFQPKLSIRSEGNGDGSVRRVIASAIYPYSVLDTTTNRTSLVSQCTFRGEWAVPQDVPQTVVDEFAAQLANLFDTSALVDVVKTQTAPT